MPWIPWTNISLGGNFRKNFQDHWSIRISPGKRYGPMIGPYEFSPETGMDQWRSKFSESFTLDRYWSIERSSLLRIWSKFLGWANSALSLGLSGPLNRDRRYYLSDTGYSAIPSRGQLELRYPLPPPPLGCDRAILGGIARYPAIPEKQRCDRYSYIL